MQILFTTSNTLLSRAIRRQSGEPVSHCAIEFGGWVIHSNLRGVNVEPLAVFASHSQIVYSVEIPFDLDRFMGTLSQCWGTGYDFGALLYLGARTVLPFLPKRNLWQCNGMFLCVEFITEILYGREESTMTPYQLYERLVAAQQTETV